MLATLLIEVRARFSRILLNSRQFAARGDLAAEAAGNGEQLPE
jgi:hypothetical protein